MHLDKKVALITGSTSGIGLGIAMRLGEAGRHILLNGFVDPEKIKLQAASLAEMHQVEVLYSNADLTHVEEIEKMINMIHNSLGGVDILVNNAGIQHVAPVEDFP